MLQTVKNWLVQRGPDSPMVRAALRMDARAKGLSLEFGQDFISIARRGRRMLIKQLHFVYAPFLFGIYEDVFESLVANQVNGVETLDFTVPAIWKYRESGISLWCASLPEEDSTEIYTRYHKPQPCETIWDVGANSGFSTLQFGRAVGPQGRVIAWEPDAFNQEYLLRNIQMHSLTNVVVERSALSEKGGTAEFAADGSTGAGLCEYLAYSIEKTKLSVNTMSLPDACCKYGQPELVKMDIEGGEVGVLRGAISFLREHPNIDFVMETHRLPDGSSTEPEVAHMLKAAGYDVRTGNDKLGQHFLWAGTSPLTSR
ncbi:MAG: FkbM family methyltransferase [Acidobacteriaceae bacterium]|nr:FkbM family methyltransferase [Acidobacteriaceae bacterium]